MYWIKKRRQGTGPCCQQAAVCLPVTRHPRSRLRGLSIIELLRVGLGLWLELVAETLWKNKGPVIAAYHTNHGGATQPLCTTYLSWFLGAESLPEMVFTGRKSFHRSTPRTVIAC